MIEIGELRLESPFSIQEILDISVEEKVNEHPLLKIKGILTSESENELYSIYDGTSITLISVSDSLSACIICNTTGIPRLTENLLQKTIM